MKTFKAEKQDNGDIIIHFDNKSEMLFFILCSSYVILENEVHCGEEVDISSESTLLRDFLKNHVYHKDLWINMRANGVDECWGD